MEVEEEQVPRVKYEFLNREEIIATNALCLGCVRQCSPIHHSHPSTTMWPLSDKSYTTTVAAKQSARTTAIDAVSGNVKTAAENLQIYMQQARFLSHHYANSFNLSTASQIVSAIEQGRWTARQVVEAFIARAIVAHAETNCLTESK